MSNVLSLLGGLGLGAGLMFLLDPDRGRRRRALARDKMIKTYNKAESAIGTTARDISNRASGVVVETRSRFLSEPAAPVADETLVARVRARLGRVVSHPRAIEVTAEGGEVTLRGPILSGEIDGLLKAVEAIPGVQSVQPMLEPHEHPDIPALQGGRQHPGERMELLQHNWSPAARVLAGMAGGALAFYGAQRRDALGATLGTVGIGLITRSLTNTELAQLTEGIGGGTLKSAFEKVTGVTGDGLQSIKSAVTSVTDKVTSLTDKVTGSGPLKSALDAISRN